jgi:Glucodextranase, domain B
MSRDLDTRARRAASNLRDVMSDAQLSSVPPGTPRRRRALIAVLRPAWVVALLLVGSAVGLAMVLDAPPATTPTTEAPVTSTTVVVTTTAAPTVTTEPAPPTTAAVVPVAPTTTEAHDAEPPPLAITSPEDGAEFEKKTITFAGTTEPGARVFAGKYEADVDGEGNWHIALILGEGKNVARFVARDEAGNEAEATVTVYYVAPTTTTTEPETPTTEKELAAFTANQSYGSCTETPPFDVFYGTGEPGSWVDITSEYGSAELQVGENGQWEKKVYFETAPAGTPFGVRIADQYGRVVEFEFVYTP